jgi:hypothetical protein
MAVPAAAGDAVATFLWLVMLAGMLLFMFAVRRAFFQHRPELCPRCVVRRAAAEAAAAENHAILRARAILSTKGGLDDYYG